MLRKYMIAAIFIVAIVSVKKNCFAYDDENVFSVIDRESVELPDDIEWKEVGIKETNEKGQEIKYVLRDKMVRVYVDNEMIWNTNSNFFVQDMFVADIDPETKNKRDIRARNRSEKEIVILLWKIGRYGDCRPFWVNEDEKDFSQHLFIYNIEGEKVTSRWGSSYMGAEAKEMSFEDGILFLKHENNKETSWKWFSFGFEKLEDVDFFMVGDNLLHEPIYVDALNKHNGKFDFIYKDVKKYTKQADFSVINLETPLVSDPKKYSTYPCFGSPLSVAEAIKKAGFDAVTLSNNHRLDKGKTGVDETLSALDENDIIHVGSMDEKPYVLVKRNEIVFALMNYTYGTNGIRPPKGYEKAVNYLSDEEAVRRDIKEASENSDFIIMFVHWGTEYKKEPDSYEIKWRDVFYDEGVDVVIGTHPHVSQTYEMYKSADSDKEMLIYYSLGNYISANQRREHNSGGYALFSVNKNSKGANISKYSFIDADTMYKSSKY